MKKFAMLLLAGLAAALAACAQSQATPTPTARPAPTLMLNVPDSSGLSSPDSGCTVITRQPTPGPTQVSIFPAVSEQDWAKGPADARVTIVEYSDFQ